MRGGLLRRGRPWIRGTTWSPDSIIWRLAWAKRDSSRSTAGSVKNPGRYTARHRSTSRSPASQGPSSQRQKPGAACESPAMSSSPGTIDGDYTRGGAAALSRGPGYGPVALLTERMTARRAMVIVAATVIGVFGLLPFD